MSTYCLNIVCSMKKCSKVKSQISIEPNSVIKKKHVKYTKSVDLLKLPSSSRNSALCTPLKTLSTTTYSPSTSFIVSN